MLGLDANMLGCRLVHAAAQAGLTEHCGASHPSTFPAIAPAYRLDGLLTPADAGVRVVVVRPPLSCFHLGRGDSCAA